jgi:hypothetical protein
MGVVERFRVDGRVVVATGAAESVGSACADAIDDAGATAARLLGFLVSDPER